MTSIQEKNTVLDMFFLKNASPETKLAFEVICIQEEELKRDTEMDTDTDTEIDTITKYEDLWN